MFTENGYKIIVILNHTARLLIEIIELILVKCLYHILLNVS